MKKTIDLSKILLRHKKGWIALTPDNRKLLASGNTLKQVLVKANRKGVTNPTVFKAVSLEHFAVG